MDTSVRPPRVLTRSFPLMTVPFTAGAPCSYWTLTCIAVSSALHSLMGFLFVSPVVCLQLPSDSTSRWTPLLFSYPFPTAGQGRDFHPIERAPAGRTIIRPSSKGRPDSSFIRYSRGNRCQQYDRILPAQRHICHRQYGNGSHSLFQRICRNQYRLPETAWDSCN